MRLKGWSHSEAIQSSFCLGSKRQPLKRVPDLDAHQFLNGGMDSMPMTVRVLSDFANKVGEVMLARKMTKLVSTARYV